MYQYRNAYTRVYALGEMQLSILLLKQDVN